MKEKEKEKKRKKWKKKKLEEEKFFEIHKHKYGNDATHTDTAPLYTWTPTLPKIGYKT